MATKSTRQILSTLTSSSMLGMFILGCLVGVQQVNSQFARSRPLFQYKAAVIFLAPTRVPGGTLNAVKSVSPIDVVLKQRRPTAVISAYAKPAAPIASLSPHSNVAHLAPAISPAASADASPSSAAGEQSAPSPAASVAPTPPKPRPQYAYTSSNWSGYLAYGQNYTSISGSWVVPEVEGSGLHFAADATWVGIGGVTSPDLIQAGTIDSVASSGLVQVRAFYEMLPDAAIEVPALVIAPGDAVSASITQQSDNSWLISIKDRAGGQLFTATVNYESSLSTAEWIEEDPSYAGGNQIPLDTFGFVTLSEADAVIGGISSNLVQSGAQGIAMVDADGRVVAAPSEIGEDGRSFNITNDP